MNELEKEIQKSTQMCRLADIWKHIPTTKKNNCYIPEQYNTTKTKQYCQHYNNNNTCDIKKKNEQKKQQEYIKNQQQLHKHLGI